MNIKIVCIKANNTARFIETVFDCYQKGQLFAISSHDSIEDFNQFSGLSADKMLLTQREGEPKNGEPERGEWLNTDNATIESQKAAQIVFTSGTEGKPKAIVLSHANLKNVVDRINSEMEIDSSIKEYIGVPVYHSFGLGRCRAVAAVGGKAYIPAKGFDLSEIKTMLANDEINAISAVPSLWRIVLDNAALFDDVADKVKWIEIGSQYMSAEEKRHLRGLFSKANIVQHYGLTEASRTALLRVDTVPDERLESVGIVGEEIQLALSDQGQLSIKGPHVAMGKVVNGQITPISNDSGWFLSSDLCAIEDNYLYFKGRADDVINCGGVKFDPANIESELNKGFAKADHVYLSKIPDDYRGDGVLLNVMANSTRERVTIIDTVDQLLKTKNIYARSAIKLHDVTEIPTTATNKIKRKQLSSAYLRQAGKQQEHKNTGTVADLYRTIFNSGKVDENSSFSSLGGDSLTYVRASITLEKMIGKLPNQWERLSVKELSSMQLSSAPKTASTNRHFMHIESGILIRFLAIIAVVCHHGGLPIVKGGATLLMLVSGYNYVRFQLLKQISRSPLFIFKSLFFHVLLPFWCILIGFLVLKGHPVNPLDVLLLSNNIYPKPEYIPFQIWFINVLVQCIVVFTLPLLLPAIRLWASKNTIIYVFILTLGFYSLRVADEFFGFGATYQLEGGQTSWIAWLFGLGALLFLLESNTLKWVLSMITVVSAMLFYWPDYSRVLMISMGGLLLIWVAHLPLPKYMAPLIQAISAGSLFIYMLHGRAPADSISADWPVDIIRIFGGILIGVVAYWCYSWGLTILFRIKAGLIEKKAQLSRRS